MDCFRERRERLMRAYPEAVFIFWSAQTCLRNSDVAHPFRQESSFYYLTGLEEAQSCLVLASQKSTLFVQPHDSKKELWEGKRLGLEVAREYFDHVASRVTLENQLPDYLRLGKSIFYGFGLFEAQDHQFLQALKRAFPSGFYPMIEDARRPLSELRLRKTTQELSWIRQCCEWSMVAHRLILQKIRSGMREIDVAHLMDYYFLRTGCTRLAYPTIVATGRNATCLHHTPGDTVLSNLVLIDAGGEWMYYAADITRTYPVSQFSPRQAQVYDLVEQVQKEALGRVRPGETLEGIHQGVCAHLTEGLLKLGLLKGQFEQLLKEKAYQKFYPHRTSHWLGMDVHDLGKDCPLEAGMVLTIEPGFYAQWDDSDLPEEWLEIRGLGIRIEDDVCVTSEGCEVLTAGLPTGREALEEIRGSACLSL